MTINQLACILLLAFHNTTIMTADFSIITIIEVKQIIVFVTNETSFSLRENDIAAHCRASY